MIDAFGIILAVTMVGTALWVLLRMYRNSRKKEVKIDPHVHRERSVWAWARVVSSTHGNAGLGGMVRVDLELEVHLPGTPFFSAKTTWLVDQEALAFVETGKEISLKVDPLDTNYIYPNGSWARVLE